MFGKILPKTYLNFIFLNLKNFLKQFSEVLYEIVAYIFYPCTIYNWMYTTLCSCVLCLCFYDLDIVCVGVCHFFLHCLCVSLKFSFSLLCIVSTEIRMQFLEQIQNDLYNYLCVSNIVLCYNKFFLFVGLCVS